MKENRKIKGYSLISEACKSFTFISEACKGYSLIEVLVVLAVFATLAIVATQALVLTLRGSSKSEITTKVRQNLDFAVSSMERQIRNAKSVNCPLSDSKFVTITDQLGADVTFSCVTNGSDKYVASSSARLTSDNTVITNCSFSCTPETSTNPASVTISLTAEDAFVKGVSGASIDESTQVFLRTN